MFSLAHLALSGVCISLRVPGFYGIRVYPRPLLTLANGITFKITVFTRADSKNYFSESEAQV